MWPCIHLHKIEIFAVRVLTVAFELLERVSLFKQSQIHFRESVSKYVLYNSHFASDFQSWQQKIS